MKVMVSGNFDPFHYAHLNFIKKASELGDFLICIVSSDKQVMMKKGKVNEPERYRAEIVGLILNGLGIKNQVLVNYLDKETTLVERELNSLRPDIFCRGTDKSIEDMPPKERQVCDGLGIEIVHIKGIQVHGRDFV